MSNKKTVVVTGIGIFSSIGNNREDFWDSLINGRSGVKRIQSFNPVGHKTRIASEVTSFNPLNYFDRKQARKMSRGSHLASAAAIEAVKDAGLDLEREDLSRIGSVIGSGAGDYSQLEEQTARFLKKGPGSINPLTIPRVIPNMPVSNAAMVLGIHGPNFGLCAACATGTLSIGMGLGLLRDGKADVVLAGGTEAVVTPLVLDAYSSMGVLSRFNDIPENASRPFDLNRDGFVLAEGASVLVLETLEHASKRGAEPLAVLNGFGMTSDAYNIALPEPTGTWAAAAMEGSLRDAGINADDIGYINAHGTSTVVNDKTETLAIKKVMNNRKVPVSSNKSMIGHALGAAGAIEAAATVLSVNRGILPPTINFETKDPDCDLDIIPNVAREVKIGAAISNSFGFGGQNGTLLFTKFN